MAVDRGADTEFRSVADTYAGFATAGHVTLLRTFRVEPSRVAEFIDEYAAGIPARRALSEQLVPIGAWQTVYGPVDEIVHLYEFGSMAELQRDLDGLLADRASSTSGTNPVRMTCPTESRLLRRVPYCPDELVSDTGQARTSTRVSMLMRVMCTRSGVGDYIAHFGSGVERRREIAANLVPVGAWRTIYGGPYYEVDHLYTYDSLEEIEEARRLMYNDPAFIDRISINTSPLPPNFWEWGGQNQLMKPLRYSRMQ
jgi:hypothetical protein